MKTIGVTENLRDLVERDGYLYASCNYDGSYLRVLEIPEDSNYSTVLSRKVNDDIGEISSGYVGRDYRYYRSVDDKILRSYVNLSNEDVIKLILKYVYLVRPRLLTRTLLGYNYKDIEESDKYKYNPNTFSCSVLLNNDEIYRVSILRGLLTIKGKEDYLLKNYKLNHFLYVKSMYLDDKYSSLKDSFKSLQVDWNGIDDRLDEIISYKNSKSELIDSVNNELDSLYFK